MRGKHWLAALALVSVGAPAAAQPASDLLLEGQRLNGQGQWAEAQPKLEAAIAAYRTEKGSPRAFSDAWNALAINRSGAKDYKAAAVARAEEVKIVRTLTEQRFADSHEEDLAEALDSLAYYHRLAGDYAAAKPAQEEAVAINRKRVAAPPEGDDQGEPQLAESLTRLAEIEWGLGNRAGARAAIAGALPIRRKIAENRPADVHSANLAESLEYAGRFADEAAPRAEAAAILGKLPPYYAKPAGGWMADLPQFGAFAAPKK